MPQDTRDPADPVLTELKKLREGPGLTIDKLQSSPALMQALRASTPAEAHEQLTLELLRLPDTLRSRALRVDLGLDLEELLGRPPTPRERDLLGDRRSSYAEVVQRDVKTIGRWSNRAVRELRASLESDHFDGHIIVAVGVQHRRLIGIEVMRYERDDESLSHGTNEGYTNPADGPSPPMVLYGYSQPEWKPAAIHFAITFMDEAPTRAWAIAADNLNDIAFGHQRFDVDVHDNTIRCRIENPKRDQVYGVLWG